jgi:hypothetical protein
VAFIACADIKKGKKTTTGDDTHTSRHNTHTHHTHVLKHPRGHGGAGEQLFIEYVDTRAPVDERRQELAQRYGFLCSCPKCAGEATAEGTNTTQ